MQWDRCGSHRQRSKTNIFCKTKQKYVLKLLNIDCRVENLFFFNSLCIVFSRSLFELLLSECSGYCDEDNHQDDDAIAGKIELNLDFQLVVEALSKSRRIHRFRYNSFTDGIFCLFVVDSICFGGLFYIYLNISLFISIFIANK